MTITREQSGAVSVLTLNRPGVLNAFDDALGRDLLAGLSEGARDDSVRCIVITGSGRAFCAGEDLAPLAEDYAAGRSPDLGTTLRERYNPIIRSIREAPKPVIAAVNGVAAGAGASLALACDYRVASESARLILAFIKVGLVPDSGALWFLSKMVGTARAFNLAVTGDAMSAEDALACGIFDEVAPRENFESTWRGAADRFAAGPTRAYALSKRLLAGATDRSLEEQLELEISAQSEAGRTADHLAGVEAFFSKQSPTFQGR
ncbi:MAG: enoyl-CoA hydratase-related protein [Actinomycetota bacterium]